MLLDVAEMIAGWTREEYLDDKNIILLRRLARKAEISRRLMSVYNHDFSQITDSSGLAATHIDALIIVLLRESKVCNDLRLLNSALKIADGVLTTPAYRADAVLMRRIDEAVAGARLHADS